MWLTSNGMQIDRRAAFQSYDKFVTVYVYTQCTALLLLMDILLVVLYVILVDNGFCDL